MSHSRTSAQLVRLAVSSAAVILAAVMTAIPARASSIKGSKHDLSVTGPGPTKSPHEREICIFCHTPHSSSRDAPLWNRYSSGTTYIPYRSSTAKAKPGQPTGSSKLCLSCHDGTVALGMVRSRRQNIRFAGGVTTMPEGRPNLGNDLSDDHPISFKFDKDLADRNAELVDPATLTKRVRLDQSGEIQCNTCHDPHDDTFDHFLVVDNSASVLCVTCHNKNYWADSVHRTSPAEQQKSSVNPWPHTGRKSVKDNGCENCHTPHAAGMNERLLLFPNEEDNCFSCHNGKVAGKNIKSLFDKISVHPVADNTGVHDPTEKLVDPPRHVECSDCHNPHAVKDDTQNAPNASGALAGVRGVSSDGQPVPTVKREYELCYRCHADSVNKAPARVPRQQAETNTRIEFDPGAASYHPVEARGRNDDVPSLISPLKPTSMVYCTDCHSSDSSGGNSGPRGPHGSRWEPILERQLDTSDHGSESSAAYALCYKCHSRSSILGNESFPSHNKHIVDERTACTTCHDPHGVPRTEHLINFNVDYVKSFMGKINFKDLGRFTGSCTLRCHDVDHDETTY